MEAPETEGEERHQRRHAPDEAHRPRGRREEGRRPPELRAASARVELEETEDLEPPRVVDLLLEEDVVALVEQADRRTDRALLAWVARRTRLQSPLGDLRPRNLEHAIDEDAVGREADGSLDARCPDVRPALETPPEEPGEKEVTSESTPGREPREEREKEEGAEDGQRERDPLEKRALLDDNEPPLDRRRRWARARHRIGRMAIGHARSLLTP
jgi:hypothetical protein